MSLLMADDAFTFTEDHLNCSLSLSLSLSSNEAIGTWLGRQIHAQEINVYADRHDPDCQIHNKTRVSIIRAQQVTEMEILNF